MKNLILLFLLVSCSTAKDLYDDVMTPETADTQTQSTPTTQETPAPIANPSKATYEDEVSKNWDYRRQLDTYIATTTSLNKKATFVIVRDLNARISTGLQVNGAKMKYREGHSVEAKIDDGYSNQKVLPTDGDSLRFAESIKFVNGLKGKKQLQIEVIDEEGPKKYSFDISGLQDFFTTI
jgi:PBP1b-binding outer membrane lipoprotein LpoB